jgi:hypothetical protein
VQKRLKMADGLRRWKRLKGWMGLDEPRWLER